MAVTEAAKILWTRIAISVAAASLLILRLVLPNLKIDAVTLGLLAAAILPWLTKLIRSAELPGGW